MLVAETTIRREEETGPHPHLNQYQGGICISGVLKTTERTLQHLILLLGPNLGAHRQCGLAICTFHLGFSLGKWTDGHGD